MADALLELVQRHTDAHGGDGPWVTPVPGLTLLRSDHEKRPTLLIFNPSLCVVLQGAKWATFGSKRVDYRAGQALVVSVDTPALGTVSQASPGRPYLGLIVEFDLAQMRDVAQSLGPPPAPSSDQGAGVFVADFNAQLADCVLRLLRLVEMPRAVPTLQPAIMREIYYWLLTGPHAGDMARLALTGTHAHSVISAIHMLRERYRQALPIEELARAANMSSSAFHRQFKVLTSMTPLQYQKQLRLLEARRLMITAAVNVETAAFEVGYESPSQFSREYVRMFGTPPRRDIAALRTPA